MDNLLFIHKLNINLEEIVTLFNSKLIKEKQIYSCYSLNVSLFIQIKKDLESLILKPSLIKIVE